MSWEEHVRQVRPYVPGLQPKADGTIVKLNTNECPYPPSPAVEEVLHAYDAAMLRLYPHPDALPLKTALAETYALSPEEIFTGVGSDEVLALAFLTFFAGAKKAQRPILFPDVTYSFYPVWAELFGIPYEEIKTGEDFAIGCADYEKPSGGVVIANPNAPSSTAMRTEDIRRIIEADPGRVVIVDEAYIDFGGETVLPLIRQYDNLLVVRTFSKSRALAGLRIGFACGAQKLIAHLNNTKFAFNSYTMNRVSIEAGCAALRDDAYFRETVGRILKTRARMEEGFAKAGFLFPPSSTNFLFVRHPQVQASALYEAMMARNIYVRHFDTPRTKDYLRISVGTDEEADILLRFLAECPLLRNAGGTVSCH